MFEVITILCHQKGEFGGSTGYWFVMEADTLTAAQEEAVDRLSENSHDQKFAHLLQHELEAVYRRLAPPKDPQKLSFAKTCLDRGLLVHGPIAYNYDWRNTLTLFCYPKHCYLTEEQMNELMMIAPRDKEPDRTPIAKLSPVLGRKGIKHRIVVSENTGQELA